jgi:enterochelin esterase-like enzyme
MIRELLAAAAMVASVSGLVVGQGGAPAGGPAQTGAAPAPQAGRGGAPAGPVVVSPEVRADGTVMLRLLAPRATEVNVTGEILNGSQPKPMVKGVDGIWTATLGPNPPDVYTYAFNIDGVNTPDPRNPWVKLVSGTGLASQVQIPEAGGPAYYDAKPVPHGLVQIMTYESKTLGATRQAYVYTPPGYGSGNTRYPVLYLLHGGGDLDPGWVMTGRANFIMDNAIAEKRAVPMVVVMPVARGGGSLGVGPAGMSPGNTTPGNVVPGAGRGAAPAAGAPAPPVQPAALGAFAQDFIGDLMPAVEKTFRVSPRPEHRAMAGLSAGGAATVNTVFSRPDLFRSVVILSAGAGQNVEQLYPKFFGNGAAAAKQMKLVWLAAGDEDFALAGTKVLDDVLTKSGVAHKFVVTKGRHEWRIWREHLNMFAPLLFK